MLFRAGSAISVVGLFAKRSKRRTRNVRARIENLWLMEEESMLYNSKYLAFGMAMVAAGVSGLFAPQAKADVILYATGRTGQIGQISKVNVTLNTVTVIDSVQDVNPDSLIFANNTTLLYTNFDGGHGQVRKVNTDGTGDALILGNFNGPADLCLTPGGVDMMFSDFGAGIIYRIASPLTSPASSVLAGPSAAIGPNPEGILFTPNGNLYANIGTRDAGADKWVSKLDPVTGAVLASSAHFQGLDGLTYDPTTGFLFATERDSSKLLKIDPTNLNSTTEINFVDSFGQPVSQIDGLEADGLGNLFIASNVTQRIYEYRISDGAIIYTSPIINGLDDLAPVVGFGSQTPEPASLSLLAVGVSGLMLRRSRRSA